MSNHLVGLCHTLRDMALESKLSIKPNAKPPNCSLFVSLGRSRIDGEFLVYHNRWVVVAMLPRNVY